MGVLHVLLLQHVGTLSEEVTVDPGWHFPVLFWYYFITNLGLGGFSSPPLEFFGEGDVVEKGPGVVELVVPGLF